MSRTLHVDLTPSRRSKRLLQNGYYLAPTGEQILGSESFSEEEDDNVSIHSNNSSIYSDRQVRYNESPSLIFSHKKRRRKILGSPRPDKLNNQSPIKAKALKQIPLSNSEHTGISRSTPKLTMHGNETITKTNRTQMRETTIHSIKQTSHRYARGESSSLARLSHTAAQYSASTSAVNTGNRNNTEAQDTTMTRNQARFNAIGGGDQTTPDISILRSTRHTANSSLRNTARLETYGDTEESHSHKTSGNHISQSQYSSAESDVDSTEYREIGGSDTSSPVSGLVMKLMSFVWIITEWISSCFGYICRTIYKTTLSLFVFDVWWLSQRTSPWFARFIRGLLLLLFVLFFLTSTYLLATRLFGDQSETLLLPVQSIAGLFQMLSQKFYSSHIFFAGRDEVVYKPIVTESQEAQSGSYPRSYIELEEALSKMELHFADKLVQIKDEVKIIKREQMDFNLKQLESFKSALNSLEGKIQIEILNQLGASNDDMAERLLLLKNEIAALRANHTTTSSVMKSDIQQLRGLLADKSKMSVQINEFNTRLNAFDSRISSLNNLMMKSVGDFDHHVGNTTYIKEIAKMQFIENFLKLIKSGEGSDDRNSLHFLFIAWLKKQGFAQIEEVDRNMKTMTVNTNLSMAVMEKKFKLHLENVRINSKRHTNAITLEKIVERPLQTNDNNQLNVNEAQIREWIQIELALYSADRIGLADHALESAGGYIVSTRCSESYNRKTALVSLFGIPIYYNINTPRSVIQSSTLPGECWSFKGAEGYLVIALSGSIQPTSFTLEHIPRELSPHNRIDSAPKDFSVLGLADMYDYTGTLLGKYRYQEDGSVIQQFPVRSDQVDYFSHVELRVSSNWGHPDYTCLYRFRVHGNRHGADMPYV